MLCISASSFGKPGDPLMGCGTSGCLELARVAWTPGPFGSISSCKGGELFAEPEDCLAVANSKHTSSSGLFGIPFRHIGPRTFLHVISGPPNFPAT